MNLSGFAWLQGGVWGRLERGKFGRGQARSAVQAGMCMNPQKPTTAQDMYEIQYRHLVQSMSKYVYLQQCRQRPGRNGILSQEPNPLDSFHGYDTSSPFRTHILCFFLLTTCSTHTSLVYSALNLRMKRGSHNSLATPRSLQHRINAFDLHPSAAVGIPSGEK
jgi:hypothetical protein